jgi:L-fuconolactonase
VKWSHAPNRISVEEYPYRDLMPLLLPVIDAFGRERIMWGE